MDPKDAQAYYNREVAYRKLGDYRQAIRDFDKAIELDLWQALEDVKTAARLGLKKAQDFLKSKGIRW